MTESNNENASEEITVEIDSIPNRIKNDEAWNLETDSTRENVHRMMNIGR